MSYARLLRIDRDLVLRITSEGASFLDYPITLPNAAFLCAEAALFVRDSLPKDQSNQQPKEQTNGTQA